MEEPVEEQRSDPLQCPQCGGKCGCDVTTHGALLFACRCGWKETVYGRPPSAAVQADLALAPSPRVARAVIAPELLEEVMRRVEEGSTFAQEWRRLGVSAAQGRYAVIRAFGKARVHAAEAAGRRMRPLTAQQQYRRQYAAKWREREREYDRRRRSERKKSPAR